MRESEMNTQDAERQVFEHSMAAHGYELNPDRYRDGTYKATYYQAGWLMWQQSKNLTSYIRQAAAPRLPGAIGARVEGSAVVVSAQGGNDGARKLCGLLVAMIERGKPCGECHLQPGERCDVCGALQGT